VTTDIAERVSALVAPLLASHGAELYDVVLGGASLQILVGGGVDLDTLAVLTRKISAALDADDPMPDRYTLEVSTPGLERALRTPAHFAGAVGERVKVKTRSNVDPDQRRADGVLASVDDTGFVVDTAAGPRRVTYAEVEKARTVFDWGAAPKPTSPSKKGAVTR
jgi:ribosome maturation factor RimP